MRMTYKFMTVAALASLVAACGNEQPMDDGASSETTARSEIDGAVDNENLTAETQTPQEPRVFEAGESNFETWTMRGGATVADAMAQAPDGSRAADLIQLESTSVVGQSRSDMPVDAGDTIVGSVWLWADQDTRIVLQLVRWCSDTESEVATEVVPVTSEPTRFMVSHTFEYAHDCVRFQIAANGVETDVFAWNASVTRDR